MAGLPFTGLPLPPPRSSMSPIGRIFIVLNLVLAVVFLGWASSNLVNSQN